MKVILRHAAIAAVAAIMAVGSAAAADLTSKEGADARTRVETAVALANIAMAEKDGEALLVATRMLAKAGPVAKAGEAAGKPAMYDIGAMAASAKEMGADAAKADEVAKMAAEPTSSTRGYWYYSCDSYNNCMWIWAGD